MIKIIKAELDKSINPQKAKILQGFFKTKKGEYGKGDIFLGISVPVLRKIAKKYDSLSLPKIHELLKSKIHEHRLVSLLILVSQYKKADKHGKKTIFDFYLKNTANINNWDLVDLTAPNIIGDYLIDNKRSILYQLARSDNLWERRISIIATFGLIKHGEYKDTFNISEILLKDKHDLIHKSAGWMLREVGKRISQEIEEQFLIKHYKSMPRTMLRYAIERFDAPKKEVYMKK